MGAGHGVELLPEQDAVTKPGGKCIMSASLDDLDPKVPGKSVYDEYEAYLRRPVDPLMEGVLKQVELIETDATHFTIKVILDGKKLDRWGFGKGDGTDRVRRWKKVTLDPDALKIVIEDLVLEMEQGAWLDEATGDKTMEMSTFTIVKDPTRMEIIIEKAGDILCQEEVRDAVYYLTDALLTEVTAAATAKVKVTEDSPSIKDSGAKSCVSGPMDGMAPYDGLLNSLFKISRERVAQMPDIEINDISDTEFASTSKSGELKLSTSYKKSVEDGMLTHVTKDGDEVLRTSTVVLHKSPMIAEHWIVNTGDRIAGAQNAKQFAKELNAAIDKANSWFG